MVAAEGWKLPNFGHYKEGRLLPVSIIVRLRREEGSEDSVDGVAGSSITKATRSVTNDDDCRLVEEEESCGKQGKQWACIAVGGNSDNAIVHSNAAAEEGTTGSKRAMARRRALATWMGIDISGKGSNNSRGRVAGQKAAAM
ncbi:hypothetical protein BHE74_00013644 [Ensete ventricosum]|nr:hypothetical protein BHE74_00013644 [Ensete ventricosum]